jgi:hypothetical protein
VEGTYLIPIGQAVSFLFYTGNHNQALSNWHVVLPEALIVTVGIDSHIALWYSHHVES